MLLSSLPGTLQSGTRQSTASFGQAERLRQRNPLFCCNALSSEKLKVVVCGNSFGRDWSNVLRETPFKEHFELSYVEHPEENPSFGERVEQANLIFVSRANCEVVQQLAIDESKLWSVRTKAFGARNGIFRNYRGETYLRQRVFIARKHVEINEWLKTQFPGRFFDLMAKVIDKETTVPVFAPNGRFISQDCRHINGGWSEIFCPTV